MKTQKIFIIDPEAYNATIQIKALECAGWKVKKRTPQQELNPVIKEMNMIN